MRGAGAAVDSSMQQAQCKSPQRTSQIVRGKVPRTHTHNSLQQISCDHVGLAVRIA